MNLKGIDTANVTINHAHTLYSDGVRAVGVYLRQDRAPLAMVQGLHSVGIKIWSIWEKGDPTKSSYFTAIQGSADGYAAATYAAKIGQPTGTPIFATFDYDSSPSEILAYAKTFQAAVKSYGYLMGAYGNGITLSALLNKGISHYTYLSQSKSFGGYASFEPKADIVQGVGVVLDGLSCDLDTVINNTQVLW